MLHIKTHKKAYTSPLITENILTSSNPRTMKKI